MIKNQQKRNTEFSVRVTHGVGCLEKVTNALTDAGVQIHSASCACSGGDGFAAFSVSEIQPDALKSIGAEVSATPILNVHVRNEAGCLSRVTSSLSSAGVTIGSLACACSPNDVSGTVAVGLVPRK